MAFNFSTQMNPAADAPSRAASPTAGGLSGSAAGGSGFGATSAPANAPGRFDPTIQQQFFDAARSGDLDTARRLLEQGTDVNAKDQLVSASARCASSLHR